jgi:hypothetical protein
VHSLIPAEQSLVVTEAESDVQRPAHPIPGKRKKKTKKEKVGGTETELR